MDRPQIAILGAGIFVKTEYVPTLAEIPDLFNLRVIWSRTEESARGAADVARKYFPDVECKWGDAGLDDVIQDSAIVALLLVLAAQFQVDLSLRLLKAGKHVLQEKPAATSITEVENALSSYNSLAGNMPVNRPIWAVAENYRFEPAFEEAAKLMAEIGDMLNFQIIVEIPMNSSSPYFSSSWRHNFNGGYILDMGVHFIAALRMIAGCEVTSVAAMTSHVDASLPPPDTLSSVIQLENGCSGVMATIVSAKTLKLLWRVVGLEGTIHIEAESRGGKFGYSVLLSMGDGQTKSSFHPPKGVKEELKTFFRDISQAILKDDRNLEAEPRLSFVEGARDFAVLVAMLESGNRRAARVQVKTF